jgi:hypothetical protein
MAKFNCFRRRAVSGRSDDFADDLADDLISI